MKESLKNIAAMEYPGRIIVLGLDLSGKNCIIVYAITGRSPSSQARKLMLEGDAIWTKPTDKETIRKGSIDLLVYPAVWFAQGIAVSNGKQTSDIVKFMAKSQTSEEVLRLSLETWSYEPDAPIYTPRVSGCVLPGGSAALSILKRADDSSTVRSFFLIPMAAGKGKMISTYSGENKDPLQSFKGEPLDVDIEEIDAGSLAEAVYAALSPPSPEKDFRVAVACVFAPQKNLSLYQACIINRHERMKAHHGKN